MWRNPSILNTDVVVAVSAELTAMALVVAAGDAWRSLER
jgi:hypothetical protein